MFFGLKLFIYGQSEKIGEVLDITQPQCIHSIIDAKTQVVLKRIGAFSSPSAFNKNSIFLGKVIMASFHSSRFGVCSSIGVDTR